MPIFMNSNHLKNKKDKIEDHYLGKYLSGTELALEYTRRTNTYFLTRPETEIPELRNDSYFWTLCE